ncbi:hypothetical protein BCGKFG_BCGKFG_04240, partial [Dysosmobacter welbionis]
LQWRRPRSCPSCRIRLCRPGSCGRKFSSLRSCSIPSFLLLVRSSGELLLTQHGLDSGNVMLGL